MRHEAISEHTEKVLMNVLAYLEEEPRRLQMSVYGEILPTWCKTVRATMIGSSKDQEAPPCGTVACLAGTILLTTDVGKDYLKKNNCVKEKPNNYISFPSGTASIAQKIAGLGLSQAINLFYFPGWYNNYCGWPEEFANRYSHAGTPEERFKVTKERVLYFIEHNI